MHNKCWLLNGSDNSQSMKNLNYHQFSSPFHPYDKLWLCRAYRLLYSTSAQLLRSLARIMCVLSGALVEFVQTLTTEFEWFSEGY